MDMGEEMKDKHVMKLEKRVRKLEKFAKDVMKYMNNWGPEVQKRRDERDAVWDEMVRVVSIQKRSEDREK